MTALARAKHGGSSGLRAARAARKGKAPQGQRKRKAEDAAAKRRAALVVRRRGGRPRLRPGARA